MGRVKAATAAAAEAIAPTAENEDRNGPAHAQSSPEACPKTVTVTVPIAFRRLSGRKLILAPDGSEITPRADATIDNAMVKALARARAWQRMLDDGRYATIGELAKGEKVAVAYLSRILRLNLLAPDIVDAILNGTQPRTLQLEQLLKAWPLEWEEQHEVLMYRAT
jgi:hypothetical protein